MRSTRKGNQYYFGMKAHVGTDTERGLAHDVVVTDASVHDSQVMDKLVYGEEQAIYGDKAYSSKEKKSQYEAKGVKWCVNLRSNRWQALTEEEVTSNHERSQVRAKVEHAFRIVKYLWGYTKVRYKGLYKNAVQVFSLFALANLYMVRHELKMNKGIVCPNWEIYPKMGINEEYLCGKTSDIASKKSLVSQIIIFVSPNY